MTEDLAPTTSRRSDRAVAATVFGVGAALVGYVLGGTAFPTDACRSSSCDDFNVTRGILGILATALAVLASFGVREFVRPLLQQRMLRRTGRADQPHWPHPAIRLLVYVGALIVSVFFAMGFGTSHFESTYCNDTDPDYSGECDLAFLEGFVWAAGAVVLVFSGATANEVQLTRRRRRSPVKADLT